MRTASGAAAAALAARRPQQAPSLRGAPQARRCSEPVAELPGLVPVQRLHTGDGSNEPHSAAGRTSSSLCGSRGWLRGTCSDQTTPCVAAATAGLGKESVCTCCGSQRARADPRWRLPAPCMQGALTRGLRLPAQALPSVPSAASAAAAATAVFREAGPSSATAQRVQASTQARAPWPPSQTRTGVTVAPHHGSRNAWGFRVNGGNLLCTWSPHRPLLSTEKAFL